MATFSPSVSSHQFRPRYPVSGTKEYFERYQAGIDNSLDTFMRNREAPNPYANLITQDIPDDGVRRAPELYSDDEWQTPPVEAEDALSRYRDKPRETQEGEDPSTSVFPGFQSSTILGNYYRGLIPPV